MKRFLWIIFSVFSIFIGASFLLFIIRMIWFPPSRMGMMMGRGLMVNHMYFWMKGTFIVFFVFIGIFIVNWVLYNKRKKGK